MHFGAIVLFGVAFLFAVGAVALFISVADNTGALIAAGAALFAILILGAGLDWRFWTDLALTELASSRSVGPSSAPSPGAEHRPRSCLAGTSWQ